MTVPLRDLDVARTIVAGRYYGVYPATVSGNQDPEGQGRVLIELPWSPDVDAAPYLTWARLATLMGGHERGSWFVPEVGDEVLVSFQGGDPNWPFVVGALWNGRDDPPQSMDAANNVKALVSRAGIRITLDDTAGAVTLSLQTPGGQQVVLADGGNRITIQDSNGNSAEMAPGGITVSSAGPLQITAPTATVDVGMLTVNSAMSTFSGVVQVDTLISNAVISASYTPGVGNIW